MLSLSRAYPQIPQRPVFSLVLANTLLSTVPGISGAGPTPEKTLLTPVLDAELVATGAITSMPLKPNTPTGCPTPATITRAMTVLTGIQPFFVNAGLSHPPTVPCMDVAGEPGGDPREGDAVPGADALYLRGRWVGSFFDRYGDLLVIGECVPGGTTTALSLLRMLGYDARVSSSYVDNPRTAKEAVSAAVLERYGTTDDPLEAVRRAGDPMVAVAAGMAAGFDGPVLLAGGTQMLAVAAVLRGLGERVPDPVTTVYIRDDESASFAKTAAEIGTDPLYVDPGFGEIGHPGLARYCAGEVKEGMGAGGALFLAHQLGYSGDAIRQAITEFLAAYG
ncbi:MAG: nicotinate mononucleotide-dependent phosphoribosyltransferase CobT [Methanomicrobiales archaeon]